ncbi:SDR family oxidoreductase [Vallitalea sediminicola]
MENSLELFTLKGEIAVITGAAGLLGKKHAEAILDADGSVVLIDINEKKLDELKEDLCKKYNCENILTLVIDITNENMLSKAKDEIIRRYEKVDILINNAANNPSMKDNNGNNETRLENFDLNMWNADVSVGLTGAFLCVKVFGSLMAHNKKGVIINISSDLGIMAPDQRLYEKDGVENAKQSVKPVTYSVVKSGIIGLTKYISTYWAENNVRCNAVAFGGVLNNQDENFIEKVNYRIPLGRLADVDEYKGTILYLCSNASSYMNGTVLVIDGGRTAW